MARIVAVIPEFQPDIVRHCLANGYLAGAVFAAMAIRAGWVRRGAGLLILIYCLGVPLSAVRVFLPIASLSDVPFLYPYAPPALMCLIPYYIGVLRLKRAVVQTDYVEP